MLAKSFILVFVAAGVIDTVETYSITQITEILKQCGEITELYTEGDDLAVFDIEGKRVAYYTGKTWAIF